MFRKKDKKRRSKAQSYLTLGLAIVFMALVPRMFYQEPTKEEQAIYSSIPVLTPQDIQHRIEKPVGKGLVLFIFASWCPHCKQQMPEMIKLYPLLKDKEVELIALSIERNAMDLAEYISKEHKDMPFSPYFLALTKRKGFKPVMDGFGSHFDGGIPYIALFNEKGTIAREWSGKVPAEEIAKALN